MPSIAHDHTAPRVAFITLGCAKNEADSARMRALLEAGGYEVIAEVDKADIAIINTCGFITEATEESIDSIFDLIRDWLPNDSARHLVVTGCLTSRYGADLVSELDEVALFISVEDEERICELLGKVTSIASLDRPAIRKAQGPSEFVKIADGCDRLCSYCTIPAIRGPYRSRTLADIASEVRTLVDTGAREIVLVAQDSSRYGSDLQDGVTLVTLIDELCRIDALAWLRILYIQPDGLTDELLDCIERNPKVCRYFEIPLQHVEERILRHMGRSGSGRVFAEKLARIRERFDDAVIRTTLIAGYPTETDAEFSALLAFIEQGAFDYVGVFAYSPEEGTPAAEEEGQIVESLRLSRANRLRRIADEIGIDRASRRVGDLLDVLVEERDESGFWQGRHRGQAPDIDGMVLIRPPVFDSLESGMILPIRIDDAVLYDLEGEPSQ